MKNYLPAHPLQSTQWGEFRKKTRVKVVNIDGVQMTIHKIPHTPWNIGYVPKGPLPTKETIDQLKEVGKKENCIFIQLEPNAPVNSHPEFISGSNSPTNEMLKLVEDTPRGIQHDIIKPSFHPLFTKYTFILGLTKNEEDLLRAMHPKTRYNIKVAQKHEVEIVQDDSDKAFEEYLKLTAETTKRQGFYAHTEKYHRLMWETLRPVQGKLDTDKLTAHLFLAKYKGQVLAAWILFIYKDTLYYPYGSSSDMHRETMASNLMMWEAIRFGKKLGLKKFDMWGALNNNPDKNDSWYGFHRFKEGYGPKHIEFIGSFDLVINPMLYQLYKIVDKIRWTFLKFKK